MRNQNKKLFAEGDSNDFSFEKNKSNLVISYNRVTFIFFLFFVITIIFTFKVIYLGSLEKNVEKKLVIKSDSRSTILDANGNIIAKSVIIKNVGINPSLVIDKKRLLLNLKLLFPKKNYQKIEKRKLKMENRK